ncbi:MAG: glycosyltransferase family A protein, partial [Candidatus Bathyarchaeia archaeon]
MPIDVIVITKNSERMLRECLCSVYSNVPVNRLIIVDGYSTDKTLNIVEEFQRKHGNVLLLQDKGNRATARQKGISHVETEWFMFVDSDVVLSRGWFRKAEAHL